MGNNQIQNNRNKIRKFLFDNENQCFSPVYLSSILNIPNGSVRRELAALLKDKQVEQNNNPFGIDHLNYYTNSIILKTAIRKAKCKIYDKTYRMNKKKADT
jgi:hypothetical protein